MLKSRASDCVLLVMLAVVILMFILFKMAIAEHLQEIQTFIEPIDVEYVEPCAPACNETFA